MNYLDPQKFDVEFPYFSDEFSVNPDFVVGVKNQPRYEKSTHVLNEYDEWSNSRPTVNDYPIYNLRLALHKKKLPLVFVDSEQEADFLNDKHGDEFVFVCCFGGFLGARNSNLRPIKDRDIFVLKPDSHFSKSVTDEFTEKLLKMGSFHYPELETMVGMGNKTVMDCWSIIGPGFKAMIRVSLSQPIKLSPKARFRQDQVCRAFLLSKVYLVNNKGLVYLNNQWFQFNGKCYEVVAKETIMQQIKDYLDQVGHIEICTSAFLTNILTQIKAALTVNTVSTKFWVQRSLCDAKKVLNLKNGLFRIRTNGKVEKICNHTADFFSLYSLNFEYREDAKCERWLNFLDEVLPDNRDKLLVQEWFGYHFCHTLQLRKYLTLFGRGANGKSVICNVLRDFIGSENCSSIDLDAFVKEFYLSETYGKLANISDEIPALTGRLNHGLLKKFIEGGNIFFNPKGTPGFTAAATAKWTQATNELVWTTDSSNGVIDRTQVIFMSTTIPEHKRNPEMSYMEYWDKEYSGIFLWAIEGFKRLLKNRTFTKSSFHQEMIDTIQENSAPEVQWLKENYKYSEGCTIPRQDIWNRYKKFAAENDYNECKRKKFFECIRLNFPEVVMDNHVRKTINGEKVRIIMNLGTKSSKEK